MLDASRLWKELLKKAAVDGLVLTSAELGQVKLSDSFIEPDSGRLRLVITCPADQKGRLGIKLSSTGNTVRRLSSRSIVAAENLLRVGDVVIAADGNVLGQMSLEDALSRHTTEHALIVHRTDPELARIIMKAPPTSLSGTYVAPFLRAVVDLTRLVGRSNTVMLGINVNSYNGIVYIVPGSPVAFEGTLQVGDVVVELNGAPLGDAWLVDVLHEEHGTPLTGDSCTLVAVRLPSAPKDKATRARAERASKNRGYHPVPPPDERRTMHGGNSAWKDYREALKLSAGDQAVARLVLQGRMQKNTQAATHIKAAYRGLEARRQLQLHRNAARKIQRRPLVDNAICLSDDSAPSAGLECLKAQAAPTHPGAQPEHLGRSSWPQERASGRLKVEGFSNFNHQAPSPRAVGGARRVPQPPPVQRRLGPAQASGPGSAARPRRWRGRGGAQRRRWGPRRCSLSSATQA